MFRGEHSVLPRKVLTRTIAVFLIVMLASSTVISYAGLKISTSYVLRTSNEVKQDMLHVYQRNLESVLTAVYQQINLFLLDKDVWSLLYSDSAAPDYLLIRDVLEKIKAIAYMNDLMDSFCFFDQKHNYVLSEAYYHKEDYPDQAVLDDGFLAKSPITDSRIVGGEEVFSIVFRPMTTPADNPATIVINIAQASLANVLPLSEDIGHFVLINNRNEVIYSSGDDTLVRELVRLTGSADTAPRVLTVGGEQYITASAQAVSHDLRLMIYHDYSSAVMRGSVLRSMLLVSALLALLGSGVLAVLASYYLYKPLKDTVSALSAKGFSSQAADEKNEYALISRVVDNLSEKSLEIERKYNEAYQYLDRYFFQEFLISPSLDRDAFGFMLSQHGLAFDLPYYCLIVLDLHAKDEGGLANVAMPDLSQYPNGLSMLAGQIGTGRVAFLCNMMHSDSVPDDLVRQIKSWYNGQGFDACIYYGNVFSDIEELSARYNECDAILGGKFFYGNDIILNDCNRSISQSRNAGLVERAKEFIALNLSRELSLDEIAQTVYLSTNYFCGVFKAETGTTVMDYITQLRIDISKRTLIDEPNLQINELSRRMGYNSAQSFIRQFKRVTGKTPEQYRRETLHSSV
jgi:AraC-like DNA-binding protein